MKRIDGTFLQFWQNMREVSTAQWQREFTAMRRAGIALIILQWVQSDDTNLFEPPDPFPTLLDLARNQKMQMVFGLRMSHEWWRRWGDADYLNSEAQRSVSLAKEVYRRYGSHPAFAGFYIPYELWDGPYTETQVRQFGSLLHTIGGACRQLAPGKPVIVAPFFAGVVSTARFEQLWLTLLEGRKVDVVALQDGVGARGWDEVLEQRVPPYFAAMQRACRQRGVRLWSDLECFRLTNNDPNRPSFEPASAERVVRQLKAVSPYVERVVTFDFYHYMSPHRGEKHQALYEGYLRLVVNPAKP